MLLSKNIEKTQHFTKPPARYSEAKLIKEMEELGIGRPSTYAMIIDTIQLVNMLNWLISFQPTESGILTSDRLTEYLMILSMLNIQTKMEHELMILLKGKMNMLTLYKSS